MRIADAFNYVYAVHEEIGKKRSAEQSNICLLVEKIFIFMIELNKVSRVMNVNGIMNATMNALGNEMCWSQ